MELVTRLIGITGSVLVVIGLAGVLFGYQKWSEGNKNDDPNKIDSGLKGMINGGVMAAISTGVTASIIATLSTISF
ncbi:hypothetical protein [Fructobacillus tropaeoli]|uniref:Uncharacterized protein n=1 Tax=Fructobacillus tropaeoli TaxID=709323 RepID=A0A3F3HBC7_9LACO|nr:hypothetical protein [Fructobacillus tropaeoli]GAP04828.1 hypothetical protein FTRO_0090290 [Fructobacillus tropaeoli]